MKKKRSEYKGVRFTEHPIRKLGRSKRPDRYFYIRYNIGGKSREEGWGWESDGFKAKDAFQMRNEILLAIKNGEEIITLAERKSHAEEVRRKKQEQEEIERKSKITFDEFFTETYWPTISNKSKVTEKYLYENWIKPVIGHKKFNEIYELDMTRLKSNVLKKGRSLRTVEYSYTVVRKVFNYARKDEYKVYDGKHPISRDIKRKATPNNEKTRYLSKEESRKLLKALSQRSPQVYRMAMLSLYCGLRLGECFNLNWGDIDFAEEKVFIAKSKSPKDRYVHLPKQVVDMLKEYRVDGTQRNEPVFKDSKGKRVKYISKTFVRTVEDIGLNDGISDRKQKFTFHSLRHTFASMLVNSGVNLYVVMELLGHSSIKMTQRYAHVNDEAKKQAAAVLSETTSVEQIDLEECRDQKVA